MKEIHTRIKSKQTKVVQYAQGKSAILRIFPETVKNNQRMTLFWESAQRDLKAHLQEHNSARC